MGDVVLKSTSEGDGGFVFELVERDVAREDVHEDADVLPSTCHRRQLDEVAANMFKDMLRVDRLEVP